MLTFWNKYRFAIIPIIIGFALGVAFILFADYVPTTSSAASPTQPLFRGQVTCDTFSAMAPAQTNLQGNLQVDHGRAHMSTVQYICDGHTRSTDTIQVQYRSNPNGTVTFTWESSLPVQWLSFIPVLQDGVNSGVPLQPNQTSYTVWLQPGDQITGATLDACAPSLPPGSVGVIPGTCQVSGGPPLHPWP